VNSPTGMTSRHYNGHMWSMGTLTQLSMVCVYSLQELTAQISQTVESTNYALFPRHLPPLLLLRKLALTHGTNETLRMIAVHPINIIPYCSGWHSYDLF
jgi:hypothetical protein